MWVPGQQLFPDVGSEVWGSFSFVPIPACAVGPDNAVLRDEAAWSLFYFTDLKMFAYWHHSAQDVRGH